MRLRMYGSTETKTLRTSTSPSPGRCVGRVAQLEVRLLGLALRARRQHNLLRHQATRQVGDEALVRQELLGLLEREVLGRDDRVRGAQVLVRELLAAVPHRVGERLQARPQGTLVALGDRAGDLCIELVEARDQRVVDAELALAQQPDDHAFSPSISFGGSSPLPSSAFIFASSSSTWLPCEISASWRSMSSPDEVRVLERAGRGELVDRARAGLHLLGLVLGALHRQPDVGHLLADPGRGLADPNLRLGGRVLRLDHFLLRAECLDLGRQRLLALDELLLLGLELLALLHDRLELRLHRGLPRQRLAGEVLAAGRQRLPRLAVELFDLLLHGRVLHLQPLLRRRHVGDAALDVLELAELLLVGIVEGLVRDSRRGRAPSRTWP